MAIKNMQEKFIHELGDIYDAEHRFLEGQQLMLKNASDSKLKSMITKHITESEQQIVNLEQVFSLLGSKAERQTCEAAKGLIKEGESVMKEAGTDPIRDCLIGSAASKVEHYEISSYRGLIAGAKMMGQKEVVSLLQQNLKQEEHTAELIEKSTPILLENAMEKENARGA